MFTTQFIAIGIICLLGAISPGPDFAIVTHHSLKYSRKVAVYTAFGIGLGLLVHVAYSILGIGLLISQSVLLFNVIKWIGAIYLIYLGMKSLRAKSEEIKNDDIIKSNDISPLVALRIGMLTNALNPKATLFILALFTQVIDPATPVYIQVLYGVEMMIIASLWFSIVAYVFTSTKIKNRLYKIKHYIERITGAVLITLGIKVAISDK